jgi:hypothetical protein
VIDNKRFPSSGSYGSSEDCEESYYLVDHAQSDFYADVSLRVKDEDWIDGDDLLGTVQKLFSIDNLWGFFESSLNTNGNMAAWFTVKNHRLYDSSKFREFMWWPFDNFSTDEFTYDQYAATFTDVGTNDKWYFNPFNEIFYEAIYKNFGNANCFGMVLESIYAQLGRSLFSEPISDYYKDISAPGKEPDPSNPRDQDLINEINIKFGYQLGANMISWIVKMAGKGYTHDPQENFSLVKAALDAGRYPLISVFDDYFFGGGHSVRPFGYDEDVPCEGDGLSGQCDRIYIADPNVQYSDSQDDPFIEIDGNNCYNYKNKYKGCDWSGGRMFMQPFELFSGPQVTPFGAFFEMINDGFFFFVNNTARVVQVIDQQNRTFFESNLSGPPTRWDQMLKPIDSMAIPNLAPVMVAGDSDSAWPFQMYAGFGTGATHSYELIPAADVPDGEQYEAIFESGKISSVIQSLGTNSKPDIITAHKIGDKGKAVSFGIPSDGVAKNITWTIAGPDKQVWAELSNLEVIPGQTIKLQVTNRGYDLKYDNDGPATTADLSVHSGPDSDIVYVGKVEIKSNQNGTFQYLLPATTITLKDQIYGENEWLLDPVTIIFSAQDFSGKGIEFIQFSRDDMATWEEGGKGENPFEFTYGDDVNEDQGETTLYFRSRDYGGNEEEPKHGNFKIDTRNPVVKIDYDQGIYSRVEFFIVDFSVNDPIPGSGIQSTAANLDERSVTNGEAVDLLWFSLGTHTLTVNTKDFAGRSATASFVLELNATLESLAETIHELRRRNEIDSDGVMKSLLAKVSSALESSSAGENGSAENQLKALLNELKAQSGKHISNRGADMLTGDVNYVINNLS